MKLQTGNDKCNAITKYTALAAEYADKLYKNTFNSPEEAKAAFENILIYKKELIDELKKK